jgi:hypothetical protein
VRLGTDIEHLSATELHRSQTIVQLLRLCAYHIEQGGPFCGGQQAAQACDIHLVPAVWLRTPGRSSQGQVVELPKNNGIMTVLHSHQQKHAHLNTAILNKLSAKLW